MSLAEELLADLEDPEDEDNELQSLMPPVENEVEMKEDGKFFNKAHDMKKYFIPNMNHYSSSELLIISLLYFLEVKPVNIHEIAILSSSNRLRNVMSKIAELRAQNATKTDRSGPVEADPEYVLIVEANNLAVEIDYEICEFNFRC